ncbi:hypothetical protein XELAEV_18003175mg [Xenopus laevis]|nr:hypothetical protein XELAEV_18003175mg [Xenopus laevis]
MVDSSGYCSLRASRGARGVTEKSCRAGRVVWLDLLKAGVPGEEINGVPTADLHKKWKQVVGNKTTIRVAIRENNGGGHCKAHEIVPSHRSATHQEALLNFMT